MREAEPSPNVKNAAKKKIKCQNYPFICTRSLLVTSLEQWDQTSCEI